MKKLLLLFLLLTPLTLFAQRFSQYYTNTLYDSFENPAQRTFIPDSSKNIAFNLFIPNFSTDAYLTGNAQASLKSRAFLNRYRDTNIVIGQNKINRYRLNTNAYAIMFKVFTSLDGYSEMGFFAQSKAEGYGNFTDESVALFNGFRSFQNDSYDNIFNDHIYAQTYHQIGFTYRERINKQFAIGFKVGLNLGVYYNKVDVDRSNITFNRQANNASLTLAGSYYTNIDPGKFTTRDIKPSFKNPGASISVGTSYRTERGLTWQVNVKDLGFIHWTKKSFVYEFDGTGTINNLTGAGREDSIYQTVNKIAQLNAVNRSFTSPTDGLAEVSVMKQYWLDYEKTVKYSPVLIASKHLFTSQLTGAFVNHFQYRKIIGTLTLSYNDIERLNFGGQFMVKTPNVEFFLGSERLFPTANLYRASRDNEDIILKNPRYTGANIFMGFAVKFGRDIEHPMNASRIPMGEEKGFIGRTWDKLFHPKRVN